MAASGMIAVTEFVAVQDHNGKMEVETNRFTETGERDHELTEYHS